VGGVVVGPKVLVKHVQGHVILLRGAVMLEGRHVDFHAVAVGVVAALESQPAVPLREPLQAPLAVSAPLLDKPGDDARPRLLLELLYELAAWTVALERNPETSVPKYIFYVRSLMNETFSEFVPRARAHSC
jgi:hypothetical protein